MSLPFSPTCRDHANAAAGTDRNISVLSDDLTMADPHEVTGAILQSYVEIPTTAALPAELTVVDTGMAQA